MYLSDRTGFDIILITDSRGGTPSKKTISKGTETMKKLLSLILALVMVLGSTETIAPYAKNALKMSFPLA